MQLRHAKKLSRRLSRREAREASEVGLFTTYCTFGLTYFVLPINTLLSPDGSSSVTCHVQIQTLSCNM